MDKRFKGYDEPIPRKELNKLLFTITKSSDGWLIIEARDKKYNIFKRKYMYYSKTKALQIFKKELKKHNLLYTYI